MGMVGSKKTGKCALQFWVLQNAARLWLPGGVEKDHNYVALLFPRLARFFADDIDYKQGINSAKSKEKYLLVIVFCKSLFW